MIKFKIETGMQIPMAKRSTRLEYGPKGLEEVSGYVVQNLTSDYFVKDGSTVWIGHPNGDGWLKVNIGWRGGWQSFPVGCYFSFGEEEPLSLTVAVPDQGKTIENARRIDTIASIVNFWFERADKRSDGLSALYRETTSIASELAGFLEELEDTENFSMGAIEDRYKALTDRVTVVLSKEVPK